MKNRKWLLLLIILLPSLLWIILESSTINSYKLPYFGPKHSVKANDTSYYSLPPIEFTDPAIDHSTAIPVEEFPLYVIMFIKEEYKQDSYRLAGLWEFVNYKKEKIKNIPVFLVTRQDSSSQKRAFDSLQVMKEDNIKFLSVTKFDSINKLYFKEKPVHIDYSFLVLVDAARNIRGYYDARYAAEVKRLIDEYKHLRLKEEKQRMVERNEIKTQNVN
jgi:hypothetical protein